MMTLWCGVGVISRVQESEVLKRDERQSQSTIVAITRSRIGRRVTGVVAAQHGEYLIPPAHTIAMASDVRSVPAKSKWHPQAEAVSYGL
jgi:hypothetical protein